MGKIHPQLLEGMLKEVSGDLVLWDSETGRPTDHPEAVVVGLAGNPLGEIPDGMDSPVGRIDHREVPMPGIVLRVFSGVDPSL